MILIIIKFLSNSRNLFKFNAVLIRFYCLHGLTIFSTLCFDLLFHTFTICNLNPQHCGKFQSMFFSVKWEGHAINKLLCFCLTDPSRSLVVYKLAKINTVFRIFSFNETNTHCKSKAQIASCLNIFRIVLLNLGSLFLFSYQSSDLTDC